MAASVRDRAAEATDDTVTGVERCEVSAELARSQALKIHLLPDGLAVPARPDGMS